MGRMCPHCGEKTVGFKDYFITKNKCTSCNKGYKLRLNIKRFVFTTLGLYFVSILVNATYILPIMAIALLVSFTPEKLN